MKLKITTQPATETVVAADARAHMHLDSTDDDTYILTLCVAARQAAELYTRRAFINTVFSLALDEMPASNYIELMRAPLVSVASVTWYDDASTATVISSSTYHTDTYAEPGRVVLMDGETWPTQGEVRTTNGIVVAYTAGYGTAATDVPQQIRTAIKETVKVWYDGEDVGTSIEERSFGRLPSVARALLAPYRLPML